MDRDFSLCVALILYWCEFSHAYGSEIPLEIMGASWSGLCVHPSCNCNISTSSCIARHKATLFSFSETYFPTCFISIHIMHFQVCCLIHIGPRHRSCSWVLLLKCLCFIILTHFMCCPMLSQVGLGSVLLGLWSSVWRKSRGSVRIHFAQPFSLKVNIYSNDRIMLFPLIL